jgi:ElaB/YqjD/DUF883 family membrane-anchored ribosome-binding protein
MVEERFDEQIQMSPSTSPGTVKETGTGEASANVQQGAQNLKADMQDMKSKAYAGKNKIKSYGRDVYNRVSQSMGSSRDVVSNVDQRVHERPWLFAAILGVSTLAIGYALGRNMRFSSPTISAFDADDIEDYT